MPDDIQDSEDQLPVELRPVVARLQEIRRKCASLGSRDDEAEQMTARLDSIIEALTAHPSDDESPPAYGQLAGQLFPVARLFESLGMLTVAREIAHVEKTLIELDPSDDVTPTVDAAPQNDGISPTTEAGSTWDSLPEGGPEIDETPAGTRMPKPVGLTLLAVLLAVLASIFIVRMQRIAFERAEDLTVAIPTPSSRPSATIRPTANPGISTAPKGGTPTPGPRARIASLIGQSRLAQRSGDIDGAISFLSQAALIDKTSTAVIETAKSLVSDLIARSDAAADNAEWAVAASYLERGRELAIRFELSTRRIDEAVQRHARMVRYVKLDPSDTAAISAAAGRRVLVLAQEGQRYEGRIHGVAGGVLELHEGIDVGGDGTLFHVDEVPLSDIREIRVYPD